MRVAYLVNQYPKVSHTFIRREIHALERAGVEVLRYAARGWDSEPVDPQDRSEMQRTRYLLRQGAAGLARSAASVALRAPLRFVAALRQAVRLSWGGERSLLVHLVYLAEACALVQWLARSGAAHLHAHFGTNPAAVAMLTRVLGGPPYSFTVHGPEEFDRPLALKLSSKGAQAAFVVAVSSFGRSQLYRWLAHEDWRKVRLVRCGLDRAYLEAARLLAPGVPRLVCVGRLCEQKGQLLLMEAAVRLIAQKVPFELVLVGDGELRAPIERLIEQHGLRAHVTITGWLDGRQVEQEMLRARALVLPSFAEGLPVVIMEAMALRRPVISTYVAGIPELVVPYETGWLVPAGSVDDLVQAMRECLQAAPERIAQMGQHAHGRVARSHDAEASARQLAQLFFQQQRAS